MSKMIRIEEFLKRSKNKHGNKYSYDFTIFNGAQNNVTIHCYEHGNFTKKAQKHMDGEGCQKCARKEKGLKGRLTTETFIEQAKQIHGEKYIYDKVIYEKVNINVIIICRIHGEFLQTPHHHKNGAGCLDCVVVVRSPNFIQSRIDRTMTEEEFWGKVQLIHGNNYIYDETIFEKGNKKIIVKCKIHGKFYPTATSHVNKGSGCKICADIEAGEKRTLTKEQFIINARKIHGDLYEYNNVIYENSYTDVFITCKIHGDFLQSPSIHTSGENGHGCNNCAIERNILQTTLTTQKVIQKCIERHGDRYIYDLVDYKGSKEDIVIICKQHGKFSQRPDVHYGSKGCGCPKCMHWNSKSEIRWLNYLNIPEEYRNIKIKIGKKRYNLDALDPTTNTIYEFHGDYWHGNPLIFKPEDINKNNNISFGKLYQDTIKRENELRALGYNLVIMWENDWKKIENQ